jgi:hypothetical protein
MKKTFFNSDESKKRPDRVFPRFPAPFGNALVATLLLFCLAHLSGPTLHADPPAPVPANPAPDLLTEALPILQSGYIDFKDLNYQPGDRLDDLIARSNGGISLATPEIEPTPLPILTASVPGPIIYWRLASFAPPKSWLDLDAQLAQTGSGAEGIILDLRSNVSPDDYAGAAQALSLFAPRDATLSRFKPSGESGLQTSDHPFQAPIVVLTNRQTTGSAEALAACLKADGALVMGAQTSGRAAIYEERKLSSGQVLRYVTAHVDLPDGTDLWAHPVTPDVAVSIDERTEKAALVLIKDNQISDVIAEAAARHRMSEAALVQGQDPEWDDYLASLEKGPAVHFLLSLPPVHDAVLIGAIDSLKAIRVAQRPLSSPSGTEASAQPPVSLQ